MDFWKLVFALTVSVVSLACCDGASARTRRSPAVSDRPSCQPSSNPPATQVNTTARLAKLRILMKENGTDALYVPMDDAHQSEYVSAYDKRILFISGFDGSAGRVVVLADKAALWTDGRYFLQAEAELDCNWILMKQGEPGVPTITEWLIEELLSNQVVGADPSLLSYDSWISMENAMKGAGLKMEAKPGMVDEVWDPTTRPMPPDNPLLPLNLTFSGETWQAKVGRVRAAMDAVNVDLLVLSALDESAWLFNLRGSDIEYNPVFIAYTIVKKSEVRLYLINHNSKLTPEIRTHLNLDGSGGCIGSNECVKVFDYYTFLDTYQSLSELASKLWVSPMSSYVVYHTAAAPDGTEDEERVYLKPSIVREFKGIKNNVEIEGLRRCHIRDSATVIDFITMLEKEVKQGNHWTEITASNEIARRRKNRQYNQGLSFESISASGANGAIIHYSPTAKTDKPITTSEMFLLDSGGQYLDGTTDVTRTFHFGEPTQFEKEAYTRVLMGSINLALAVWPRGTYGRDIDALTRQPLWSAGLDYRHGTGHGIGAFLSVHEGPGRINLGYRPTEYESPLYPHMFFSDEPGYYEDGKFGIRLETIVMTTVVNTTYQFGGREYIGFEPFTLVPFEPNLILYDLLNSRQRNYINRYHKKCQDVIGKVLQEEGNLEAYEWLTARTKPIPDEPYYTSRMSTVFAIQPLLLCTLLLLILI